MSIAAHAALVAVRAYQWLVSPLLPGVCRFVPTCSEYAAESFISQGFMRGVGLTVRRLVRCQPLSRGGFDPPPPRRCEN